MCSYIEIQNPPKRYGVIDIPCMQALFGYSNFEHFTGQYRHWVQVTIDNGKIEKEGYWTESVAVGALRFVEEIKARLGIKGMGRRIEKQTEDRFVVKEAAGAYSSVFELENGLLSQESSYFLDDLDL